MIRPHGHCRSCGQKILWAPVIDTGRLMPLDPDPATDTPVAKLVALYPGGGCRVLRRDDFTAPGQLELTAPGQLQLGGATLHHSHWATCPQADLWRRSRSS